MPQDTQQREQELVTVNTRAARSGADLEYVTREDFERIKAADPRGAQFLERYGVSAYNQRAREGLAYELNLASQERQEAQEPPEPVVTARLESVSQQHDTEIKQAAPSLKEQLAKGKVEGVTFTRVEKEPDKALQTIEKAPDYVSVKDFTRQYFQVKGWDYVHRGTIRNDEDLRRIMEAEAAHKEKFAAPVTLKEYQAKRFEQEGWAYDIPRHSESENVLKQHDERIYATAREYAAKYGNSPIVMQGLGNLAEMAIPGVYVAKHWNDLSVAEKTVNIAIDVAFVGLVFGKPATAAVKSVVKKAYGAELSEKVVQAMNNLKNALKTKSVEKVRTESNALKELGQGIKSAELPGGENLMLKANQVLEHGVELQTLKKGQLADDVLKGAKDIGKGFGKVTDQEIDAYRAFRNRVKNPNTKAKIEEALKNMERQRKIAVKEKEKVGLFETNRVIWPDEVGKNVPATIRKQAVTKLAKTRGNFKVAGKAIPIASLATKSITQLANKYNVKPAQIVASVLTLPKTARKTVTLIRSREISRHKDGILPYLRPAERAKVISQPEARTQPQPEAKTQPQPEARTQPQPEAKIGVKVETKTTPLAKAPSGKQTKTRLIPKRLGGTQTDKQIKRELVALRGLIAWRQGELHNEDIWHIIKYPYKNEDDYLTVVGVKPPGASVVKGAESAYKTANLLYGVAPARPLMVDMGIQDVHVSTGGKVRFTADPGQITTGDFSISGKSNKVFPLSKGGRNEKA